MEISPIHPARPLIWPDLVLKITAEYPEPEQLYLVGGVVRDALIGYPIHDIDIATAKDGLIVARQIAKITGGAYYPIDRERHTGRVIVATPDGQLHIDVASFRGDTLLDDLTGRDFTINAMAVNLGRLDELLDPMGGLQDLFKSKILRQCTAHSIQDDPVRSLRAIRHAQKFSLRIEPDTAQSIKIAAAQLAHTDGNLHQPERCRDEFFKSLDEKSPAGTLRILESTGLLSALTPFAFSDPTELHHSLVIVEKLHRLFQIISPKRSDNTAADLTFGVAVMILDRYRTQLQEYLSQQFADGRTIQALLLIGAFTPRSINAPGELWSRHLHLSNNEVRIVDKLAETRAYRWSINEGISVRGVHQYYQQSGETGIAGILLYLAEFLANNPMPTQPEIWGNILEDIAAPLLEAFFKNHQKIVSPPPLITGDTLLHTFEIEAGPQVGKILKELLEAQAAGEITTKKEALVLAERLLHQSTENPGKDSV